MTGADRSQSLTDALAQQHAAWNARPLVRRLYGDWHREIASHLAGVPGPSVELGSGIGRFKASHPAAIATDVEPTPWSERVVDAHELPYAAGEVANLILVDVFHHLRDPARFLDEATRVLRPGGRAVVLDPYCSPVSTLAYRAFHHERTDLSAAPFGPDGSASDRPLEGNQARATLVFHRHRAAYEARWPALPVVVERRIGLLAYPLSGGFTKRRLAPAALYRPLSILERALQPLAPLLAFRTLIVLERR